MPMTNPAVPANSQIAKAVKYFIGTPTTSWITCAMRGSRRIFPRPEKTNIAARSIVIRRYAALTNEFLRAAYDTAELLVKSEKLKTTVHGLFAKPKANECDGDGPD